MQCSENVCVCVRGGGGVPTVSGDKQCGTRMGGRVQYFRAQLADSALIALGLECSYWSSPLLPSLQPSPR